MDFVKLNKIAEISSGQGAPQGDESYEKTGIPFIKAGNLEDLLRTKDEYKSCYLVSIDVAKKYRLKEYPIDTIVFAKSGMSAMKGRVYCLKNPSYVVNHLATIIPKKDKVIPQYLKYFFQVFSPTRLIKDRAYPSIRLEDISNIEIYLPTLDEQQKIISLLDEADELQRKRNQAVGLLNDYVKSIFLKMFGDPVTNSKGWQRKSFQDVSEIKIGPFGSLLHKHDYIRNGIPLVNPTHIVNKKIVADTNLTISEQKYKQLQSYHMKAGDIVLGRRGEIGRCGLVTKNEDGYLCGTGSMFIRPIIDLNPIFLVYYISTNSFKLLLESRAIGITMKNLNASTVQNMEINIPPKELQDKFEDIVKEVNNLELRMHEESKEFDNQFRALMQKSFTN